MLTKNQKAKTIDDLAEKFKRQKIALWSDFHGLSVGKLQELRRSLKKIGGEFKVAKKTFLSMALKKAGIDFDAQKLSGEIGIVWGYTDEISPTKLAYKFGRANSTFKLLGGIVEGKILGKEAVLSLAKIPPREELLAKLVWTLQSPVTQLVRVLQGNTKNLVVVLNKIKENK